MIKIIKLHLKNSDDEYQRVYMLESLIQQLNIFFFLILCGFTEDFGELKQILSQSFILMAPQLITEIRESHSYLHFLILVN